MRAEDAIEKLEEAGFQLNRISEGSGRIVVFNTPKYGTTHLIIGTDGSVNDKQVRWYLNRAHPTGKIEEFKR